ncbi:nucleotidyl transferase AbiEii/AbiGii toxin family protein [Acidobacteriota bacterium]
MTKRAITNKAASVRQLLLNQARDTGRPFNELLQYFAMERFLYRLSKSPHAGKFALKGALMLTVWKAPISRPTMDIDVLGRTDNSIDNIVSIIEDLCLQSVEPDGLMFDPASVQGQRIIEDADYHGIRIRFRGNLDTARITLQFDVGFGDAVVPGVRQARFPTLLDFPKPVIQAYSKESTISEKLEAMVKLGALNSRMKDFFDIWLLSRLYDFKGQILAKAIVTTFETRKTEIPEKLAALTKTFSNDEAKIVQWRAFLRRSRLDDVPGHLSDIITAIHEFLEPVIDAASAHVPFRGEWKAPGPWSSHQ